MVMHIVVTMDAKSWFGWLVDGMCRMIMHGDGDNVAWIEELVGCCVAW